MEYTIDGTQGRIIMCGDRAFRLVEDIRTDAIPDAQDDMAGIICLSAQAVPVDDPATDWQYEAHWSVVEREEWDAISAPGGDIDNRAWFSGIIGVISTDTQDDMISWDADGNVRA